MSTAYRPIGTIAFVAKKCVTSAFLLLLLPQWPLLAQPLPKWFSESDVESVNRGMRERDAKSAQRAEQESRIRNIELEYASKREAAQAAIQNLPDTPDRQKERDRFSCMYPRSATLPPTSQAVEDCMDRLAQSHEVEKQAAAAEEERKAEEKRRVEQEEKTAAALQAAEEFKAESERKVEAAAALAAQEAASAKWQTIGLAIVLSLAVVIAFVVYRRRRTVGPFKSTYSQIATKAQQIPNAAHKVEIATGEDVAIGVDEIATEAQQIPNTAHKGETETGDDVAIGVDNKYCIDCGAVIQANAEICPECGVRQPAVANQQPEFSIPTAAMVPN